jgi:glycosyltransferase involved in cell wall biosynthesis
MGQEFEADQDRARYNPLGKPFDRSALSIICALPGMLHIGQHDLPMESDAAGKDESEPLVSVIIPCYNSERTIVDCLNSITNQITSVSYDITVVDSSIDNTSDIVARQFPQVRLVRLSERAYAGVARNIGIKATRGKYCLMIDSDCICSSDLIERVIDRHAKGDYAAVGGSIANGTPHSWSGLLCYLMEFKEFIPTTPMRLVTSVPTANVCYRRDVIVGLGGFDPAMWLAEDILLNWRMHQAGGRILFDPAIRVTHLNRTGFLNVLSYQANMGKYSAIARQRGGLPGKIVLRFPVLAALMPFGRLVRAALWLLKNNKGIMARFLVISPMYLLAAIFWSFGFFQQAARQMVEGSSIS